MTWLVIVGPIGLAVVVVVAARIAGGAHARRLRRSGLTAAGEVTALGTDRGDGLTSAGYWAAVSYDCAPLPSRVTIRLDIAPDRHRALHEGSRVTVGYLPGRPESARLLG